ncbi:hypothetical protein [Nocardioides sp. T2.26MG-1]|uniref:hypothetical protein n=1 Tax=Nocardioides sp. T2.26MG-1 TaxID=3041166 RepID=UPI00247737A2|nr:hypothetical protein [Nocardioides sp. T2.26MG-1]CAI9417202.1 3'-5' exonuclease DinG [Nocardioides sp. T2.26MG-1]
MSASKWHELPVAACDTETTSPDPAQARIVTAAVVHMQPGERPKALRWIIDPGIDIPTEASDIHGYTRDRILQLVGRPDHAIRILNGVTRVIPRDAAIFEITAQVAATIGREQALVVHNAAYDLTLLEHEAARHDVDPLTTRPHGVTGVVDPMVIEKQYDPYRKSCYKKHPETGEACDVENRIHVCGGCRGGKWTCGGCGSTDRTLTSLCAHYGVPLPGAHDAAVDAIASVRLLGKLLSGWPQLATWKLGTLHAHQETWRAQQQAGLREFFDKVGKPNDGCCGAWPLHTTACADAHRQVVAA